MSHSSTIDFSYPEPGVQLATSSSSSGDISQVRTVFDPRGNALSVDGAGPPGSAWVPQLRQSFEGCGAAPP